MPSKNVIKIYEKDCYYHIYNRGVEKRLIFIDIQDLNVFYKYMKNKIDFLEMVLDTYTLQPNHFHMLIEQRRERDIEIFMRSIGTKYSMYFNNKYSRVGPLFQGVYKARKLTSEEEILKVRFYINRHFEDI